MKEETIQISVIIPVYNVENYLTACLDSVLHQTYSALQIILIDDGSSDRSSEICDAYAVRDKRIELIHQENKGLSIARNTGMKMAKGKYVLFVDSDDILEPKACESLLGKAEAVMAEVVAGSTYWIDETGGMAQKEKIRTMRPHAIEAVVSDGETYLMQQLRYHTYMSTIWAYLYKRDFLVQNDLYFIEGVCREDEEWMLHMFCCAKRIAQCEITFYQYHLWKNSVMRNTSSVRMAKDFIDVICPQMMQLVQKVKNVQLKELIIAHIIRTYLASVSFYPDYYAQHKSELDFSFLYQYTKGKIWVWIILLRLSVRLFCRMWNARGNLKS